MKTRLLCVLVLMLVVAGAAQAQNPYVELMRQDLRTAKTAIVTEGMMLTDEEGEAFWPVYREYETKLAALWDQRIALIESYAEHYSTMDEATADKLMGQSLQWHEDRLKLVKKTYGEMKKQVGPILAARFAQIDGVIQNLVDLQIAAELPLAMSGGEAGDTN